MGRGIITCGGILLSATLAAAGPPPSSPAPETTSAHRRNVATFVAVSGLALVGVGIGLGVYANHEHEALTVDRAPGTIDHDGVERARLYGDIGTITAGVGLAAAVTGVVLWWTAPADREPAVVPTVTGGGGGFAVTGRF